MTENSHEKKIGIEVSDKLAEQARIVEELNVDSIRRLDIMFAETDELRLQEQLNSSEKQYFPNNIPQQFDHKTPPKYEPTIRPNFWIPLLFLFATLIPFIFFGTVFVVVKDVQLLPVHYMTDPTNPVKVLRLLAFFMYLSIPSLVSLGIASFLLKTNKLPKGLALTVWILGVVMTTAILLFFLTPKEF